MLNRRCSRRCAAQRPSNENDFAQSSPNLVGRYSRTRLSSRSEGRKHRGIFAHEIGRQFFEERSQHVAMGREQLPFVGRRVYRRGRLGQPIDTDDRYMV